MIHKNNINKTKRTCKKLTLVSLVAASLLIIFVSNQINSESKVFIVANGAYLEDMAQFSHALASLIDLLLEKVNFLTELVIDAALEENCDFRCLDKNETSNLTKTGAIVVDELFARQKGEQILQKLQFDVNSNNDKQNFEDIVKSFDLENKLKDSFEGCKVFNLNVEASDLPSAQMENCCKEARKCYATCGNIKLNCDLQFQDCLKVHCKQRFGLNQNNLNQFNNNDNNKQNVQRNEKYNQYVSDELYAVDIDDDDDKNDDDDDQIDKQIESSIHQSDKQKERDKNTKQKNKDKLDTIQKKQIEKDLAAKYKACRLASKILIIGSLAFGCQQFQRAQTNACCVAS